MKATVLSYEMSEYQYGFSCILEFNKFNLGADWFGCDFKLAKRLASKNPETCTSKLAYEFWSTAVVLGHAPNLAPLTMKLCTCVQDMGLVARHHHSTAQHRTKFSNLKLDTTTEAYCGIKLANNTKRHQQEVAAGTYQPPSILQNFIMGLDRMEAKGEGTGSHCIAIASVESIQGDGAGARHASGSIEADSEDSDEDMR